MAQIDPEVRAVAIFLDAKKAFDSVEWAFMYSVLHRVGVGEVFLQLIQVLYAAPEARLRINGKISDPIQVERGTRQGCPLSPLFYTLVAEPLLCALREYHSHRGYDFLDTNSLCRVTLIILCCM